MEKEIKKIGSTTELRELIIDMVCISGSEDEFIELFSIDKKAIKTAAKAKLKEQEEKEAEEKAEKKGKGK